jgi:hypothetical protein
MDSPNGQAVFFSLGLTHQGFHNDNFIYENRCSNATLNSHGSISPSCIAVLSSKFFMLKSHKQLLTSWYPFNLIVCIEHPVDLYIFDFKPQIREAGGWLQPALDAIMKCKLAKGIVRIKEPFDPRNLLGNIPLACKPTTRSVFPAVLVKWKQKDVSISNSTGQR